MKILPALPVLLSLLACGGAAATATPFPTTAPAAMSTPAPGPFSGTPESTPVMVWPSLIKIEPSVAAPGEDVNVEGLGGLTKLRTADGRVTGHIESARSFGLYFDGEPVGSFVCQIGSCRGALTVPDGASPGSHQISVEGGSTRPLMVSEAPTDTLEGSPTMTPQPTGTSAPFTLLTSAFPPAGAIPVRYTCDGEDISPALFWTSSPPGTGTFVVTMDDPDAPGGTWDHWVVFNIPAGTLELPEGRPKTPQLPGGAVQGSNSWGDTGYAGPCPPPGPAHTYRFFL